MNNKKMQGGIIIPAYQHRYRLDITPINDNESRYNAISAMALNVTTEFLGDTTNFPFFDEAKAYITLELAPDLTNDLREIYRNSFNMKVITLDGSGENPNGENWPIETLTNCRVTNIKIKRNYKSNKTVKVKLEITAEQYNIQNG